MEIASVVRVFRDRTGKPNAPRNSMSHCRLTLESDSAPNAQSWHVVFLSSLSSSLTQCVEVFMQGVFSPPTVLAMLL